VAPITLLAWANVVMAVLANGGELGEKLWGLGQKIRNGEDVTRDELEIAKASNDQDVADWLAAAGED